MVLIYQRGPRKRKPAPGEGEKTMKKKVLSLLLAIVMVCSLAACGGDKDPKPERDVPSEIVPKVELSKDEQEPDAEPEDAPEPEPEPEPIVMNYTFEDGTLTCSGNGEIVREDWIEVVKNAIFDPNETACAQALEALVIEPGVTGIGDDAFLECENLSGALSLPDSVTRIGESAFRRTSLTSAKLPDEVTEIGQDAFAGCKSLTSASIPKNLTEIPARMFTTCTSLTDVEIPNGVTSIKRGAFYECAFETITIPDSVTSIGEQAFAYCKLKTLTIPDSVTSIENQAFSYTLIEELTIPASVTEWNQQSLCLGPFLTDVTILCDATMDNVPNLLNGLFYRADTIGEHIYRDEETYRKYAALGFVDLDSMPVVTIHAPAGSVVEGYAKRQIEENSYLAERFAVEVI